MSLKNLNDVLNEGIINDIQYKKLQKIAIDWLEEFNDLDSKGNIKNKDLRKYHGNEEECWIEYFFNINDKYLK